MMSDGGCSTVSIKLAILKNLEEILSLDALRGWTKDGKKSFEKGRLYKAELEKKRKP